jgi:hypothetical protein
VVGVVSASTNSRPLVMGGLALLALALASGSLVAVLGRGHAVRPGS